MEKENIVDRDRFGTILGNMFSVFENTEKIF